MEIKVCEIYITLQSNTVTNPFRVFMCGKSFQCYPVLIPSRILFLCW